ncbi:MAG: hypothetical protein ACXVAU_18180, partial [Mucilaginibacter sp.]
MKYTFILLWVLLAQSSFAQQMSYKEWQDEAKSNIRLLPEYGHAIKTKEQVASDEELIKDALNADTTHRKASDHFVQLGFTYLGRG